MRIIIGQAHRERILKYITPHCRVLEWGSGGSTLWLADRLPVGATLTSIDHDEIWHANTQHHIGKRPNVQLLLCPPRGVLGRNATVEEEDPSHLQEYIHAVDNSEFDLILVDGVARVACMERSRDLLSSGGVIFLHDAHRPWYDSGKELYFEHGTQGSCQEYPGPLLWWGGLKPEEPRFSIGALPIVVNCYTTGTPYEIEVENLRASLDKLGMEHEIIGVPSHGTWEKNCAFKSQFIFDMYKRLDRPVLWVDADAVVNELPMLLAGAEADFAIGKTLGWQFNSGTAYFNRTPLGELLLKTWVECCRQDPKIWDQIHLDRAWEEITAKNSLYTQWLPQTYVKIFDMPWESRLLVASNDTCRAVIEQFQASRRFKSVVSKEVSTVSGCSPSGELIKARKACRLRAVWYDERLMLKEKPPAPDSWAKSPQKRFSIFR